MEGKRGRKEDPIDDNEAIISDHGVLLEKGEESEEEKDAGDGSESDSSVDIHTLFRLFS